MYRPVEGERVRLRPANWGFTEDEWRRRYVWSLDEELQYWSGSLPGGRSLEQFKHLTPQRDWPSDGRRISYAIYTKGGELIGMVSCYGIEGRWGSASLVGELGVYIGEKRYWSHGYGTDAVSTFLRHLFTDLGFHLIYLHTYESNVRAQKSYLRVGFEEREKRRRYSTRVGYHQELRMEISRERFEQLQGSRVPALT